MKYFKVSFYIVRVHVLDFSVLDVKQGFLFVKQHGM